MQLPLPKAKPAQIILYHNDCRGGKSFNLDKAQEDYEELVDKGWVDTPAKLEELEVKEVEVTAEEVEAMSPNQLVKKVKAMGFHVLTDVELAAKIAEATPQPVDNNIEPLINRYIPSPTSLTKEELVVLGADYGLKLKMTMNEATMIGHINEAIENSKGE